MHRLINPIDYKKARSLGTYWDAIVRRSPDARPHQSEDIAELAVLIRTLHHAVNADSGGDAMNATIPSKLIAKHREMNFVSSEGLSFPTAHIPFMRSHTRTGTLREWHASPPRCIRSAVLVSVLVVILAAGLAFGPLRVGRSNSVRRSTIPAAVAVNANSTSVPMYRVNAARTGEMPGAGPSGDPVERWRFATEYSVTSSPAVVDGVVYVGSRDKSI